MAPLKASSLLLGLLLLGACGKQVTINTDKLREASQMNPLTAMKEGTLIKGTPSRISIPGATYDVSKFSSHLALQFIKTIPEGQSVAVRYVGTPEGNEIILSQLENK